VCDKTGTGVSNAFRLSAHTSGDGKIVCQYHDPAGRDCNNASGCRRVRFSNIEGTAPATPGVYRTTWNMVDEWRS